MMGPPAEIHAVIDVDGSQWKTAALAAHGARRLDARVGRDIRIDSSADHVNGVFVHGNADFTLDGARLRLAGAGSSDFDGVAAGVLVRDDAKLVVRHADIVTRGAVSTAITATGKARLEVRDSKLVVEGGPLPSGYVRHIGPGMMEPPTPLGIVGTARATLTMGESKAYYYDTTIIADGWGALSTDAAHGAYLEANRCNIVVRRSGYGTYADNGATVVINDSKVDAATFAGIIAGQASIAFRNVTGRAGYNGVMIHDVMGSPTEFGTLAISGGRLESNNAVILVKSANAKITIDHAQLASRNGDLILAVVNDDAFATKTGGKAVSGVEAVIRNSRLTGNLIDVDTDRHMSVDLDHTTLKGRVHNVELKLGAGSHWTATADSQVLIGALADASQIDAAPGVTITAKALPGLLKTTGRQKLASGGTLVIE